MGIEPPEILGIQFDGGNVIAMVENNRKNLRVAFVVGTLGQGGAEKQLMYMIHALLQVGVNVRVYTLTRNEYYEPALRALGVQPQWIGKYSSPIIRLIALGISLRDFRPHVLQSTHFYTNIYAGVTAPIYHAVGIGCVRSDVKYEMESNPFWGKLLLTKADSLIVNSQTALGNAAKLGIAPEKVNYLPNVIDLMDFDRQSDRVVDIVVRHEFASRIVIVSVGGLLPAKRFDRFITALSIARQDVSSLLGVIIGNGPEMAKLQAFARRKGLSEQNLIFLGKRDDVPAILRNVDIFALTSDHEGFPNVLLEAMAARLPVITTPAGDSGYVVQDGLSGYVVPYDDINRLAECMIKLATSVQFRRKMGQEGRTQVEQKYGADRLAERLLSIYLQTAKRRHSCRLLSALSM